MKNALILTLLFTAFAAAQDNTWVQVAPQASIPSEYSGLSFVGQMAHGYGNLVYRPSSGTFLYMDCLQDALSSGCRQPNSFYANAVCSWNPQANTLGVLKVGNWGGGSYGNGCLLPEFANDTTPAPRHTYEGFVYVDSTDALYLMLGAYTRIMGGTPTPEAQAMYNLDVKSTWKYTFSNNRWRRIASHVSDVSRVRSSYETHMVHWSTGGKILWAGHYGWEHAEFDLASETWELVTTVNRAPFSLYGALSDWDSQREIWIFRKGDSVATYNPATKTYTALPGCGLSKSNICYLPDHDVYLATGGTAAQTKIYNPGSRTWTLINGGSLTFDCNSDLYMRYDPVTGKAGIVTDAANPRYYTFKYVPVTNTETAARAMDKVLTVAPNPFNSRVNLKLQIENCELPASTRQLASTQRGGSRRGGRNNWNLGIYDIKGKLIGNLKSKIRNPKSEIEWNASGHTPGLYIVRLTAGNRTYTKRVTLLK